MRALLFCALCCATACSEDDSKPSAGNSTTSHTPDASPVSVQGTVTEVTLFEPVAGANVCVLGSEPATCTTTDAGGYFALELASDPEIAVDISAPELVRTIVALGSRDGDGFIDARAFPASALAGLVDVLAVPADPTKGHLLVLKSTEGASATLSSGESPVYFGPGGVPLSGATTTGKNGGVGFFNVTPGTVELVFESPTTCELPLWTGTQPSSGRLPIVAGALTTVNRFYCE